MKKSKKFKFLVVALVFITFFMSVVGVVNANQEDEYTREELVRLVNSNEMLRTVKPYVYSVVLCRKHKMMLERKNVLVRWIFIQ